MNPAPSMPARITGWDRAAIVALGAAGCALSYDALQQMAIAIHVRGLLTYLFPLVIDGFIAYGVRALVVLRTAPFWSRLYVWALFGTATAASIWANALHAVRLNQQHHSDEGLELGDGTVGVLSTLAPLALAGAVHLYILIARRITTTPGYPADSTVLSGPAAPATTTDLSTLLTGSEDTGRTTRSAPNDPATAAPQPSAPPRRPAPVTYHPVTARPRAERSNPRPDRRPEPDPSTLPTTRTNSMWSPGTDPGADQAAAPIEDIDDLDRRRQDRPDLTEEPDVLLHLARQAVTESGKVTRSVVADAIRGRGLPLANDRLTALMRQLRQETERPTG